MIDVRIYPFDYYIEYEENGFVSCGIVFDVKTGTMEKHIKSECNNTVLKRILDAAENTINGSCLSSKLSFCNPYNQGSLYPYYFDIDGEWTFCYEERADADEFRYVLSKEELSHMYSELKQQFEAIDWNSLGKAYVYHYDIQDSDYEWCYSAKELERTLEKQLRGKRIKAVFVSSENYGKPLEYDDNYADFYLGEDILIQIGDMLIAMKLFGEGLVKLAVYPNTDLLNQEPVLASIRGYKCNDFCEISDYFIIKYKENVVSRVFVEGTKNSQYQPDGFDNSKAVCSKNLPNKIIVDLEKSQRLILQAHEDDFIVKMELVRETNDPETYYYMEAASGCLVRVSESKLSAWSKTQDAIRAKEKNK